MTPSGETGPHFSSGVTHDKTDQATGAAVLCHDISRSVDVTCSYVAQLPDSLRLTTEQTRIEDDVFVTTCRKVAVGYDRGAGCSWLLPSS